MNQLVWFSIKNRILIVIVLAGLLVAGLINFLNLNIEAYPDPVPPLVNVITQNHGQSAEEIERYITIPIEVQLSGLPHVSSIRTTSLFGLSDVKVQFTYDITYREAEQLVLNRLGQLPELPNQATPEISPVSPTGEIYRYRVVGPPGYSVADLKTIQTWVLERRLKGVPGVIDVNGWGGKSMAYEVDIDLSRLQRYDLTVPQVLETLSASNTNVGGQTVNLGPQAAVVRGVGLIHSLDDIENTMLATHDGTPIFVKDIATVRVGHEPRLGIAGNDAHDDIVQGIVLMRRGEQTSPTIKRVEAEVAAINASDILPPGVKIEKIYARSDLIEVTTNTVITNLILGLLLVFAIQWIFLGNLRSAIIVCVTIPFAFFFALGIMKLRGESANLLSVGALDFGLIVEATVIMVENVYRHLAHGPGSPLQGGRNRFGVIASAAGEVNKSIFFSAAIIVAGFVPLFSLSGVEGHIFGPMAKTYAYAIAGGLLATFTVAPALSALLLTGKIDDAETAVVRWLRRLYSPLVRLALRRRAPALAVTGLLVVSSGAMMNSLGLEFLPKLEEGNMWVRATMPPSISLEEGNGYVNKMRRIIQGYPEVQTVVSQNGRPDDGTDATGFFNAEFFVPLKPFNQWRPGVDKENLITEISDRLTDQFPGIEFGFSQYIEDNVAEAASGVKGQNSVNVYGADLEQLEKSANEILEVLRDVPGITDLAVLRTLGQPTVKIDIDRARAARYGLTPDDINATVQTAIGGQQAGNLYERASERNFPIIVRLAPEYRQSIDALNRITIGVDNPYGQGLMQVPLSDVADVSMVSGASFVYRQNQTRYIPIKFSVRGRDLGGAVEEAQQKVAENVTLPRGYHMEWVGEFGQLEEALARLQIVVPLAIVLILLLLYMNFGSLVDTLLTATVMPMALIGGIFALFFTGTPFSVSAAIGFVALLGISVMAGIIVLAYFNQLVSQGMERGQALITACETQLRPVVMTCAAACVGLLPAAFSTGIGSQVQKPLALVVVGGMLLAPILIMVVFPVLINLFSKRTAEADDTEEEPALGQPAQSGVQP